MEHVAYLLYVVKNKDLVYYLQNLLPTVLAAAPTLTLTVLCLFTLDQPVQCCLKLKISIEEVLGIGDALTFKPSLFPLGGNLFLLPPLRQQLVPMLDL